jgi:hypothetical protein
MLEHGSTTFVDDTGTKKKTANPIKKIIVKVMVWILLIGSFLTLF